MNVMSNKQKRIAKENECLIGDLRAQILKRDVDIDSLKTDIKKSNANYEALKQVVETYRNTIIADRWAITAFKSRVPEKIFKSIMVAKKEQFGI